MPALPPSPCLDPGSNTRRVTLDAARLTCSVLDLSGVRIIGDTDIGAVLLLGAHIGGQLGCDGANMRNDSGPALVADSLQVGLGMLLRRGFTATGAGERGAVRLTGAHIGGHLVCDGASLRNDSGPALRADTLRVGLAILSRGLLPPAPATRRGPLAQRPRRRQPRLHRGQPAQ